MDDEVPADAADGTAVGRAAAAALAANRRRDLGHSAFLVAQAQRKDSPLTEKFAQIQRLAEKSRFASMNLPQLAVPVRPAILDTARRMEEQREETERALTVALDAKHNERAARLKRELQSLELAQAMVDAQHTLIQSQQALIERQDILVAAQQEQARDGRIARRWEIAVFVVSLLALIATIILR